MTGALKGLRGNGGVKNKDEMSRGLYVVPSVKRNWDMKSFKV